MGWQQTEATPISPPLSLHPAIIPSLLPLPQTSLHTACVSHFLPDALVSVLTLDFLLLILSLSLFLSTLSNIPRFPLFFKKILLLFSFPTFLLPKIQVFTACSPPNSLLKTFPSSIFPPSFSLPLQPLLTQTSSSPLPQHFSSHCLPNLPIHPFFPHLSLYSLFIFFHSFPLPPPPSSSSLCSWWGPSISPDMQRHWFCKGRDPSQRASPGLSPTHSHICVPQDAHCMHNSPFTQHTHTELHTHTHIYRVYIHSDTKMHKYRCTHMHAGFTHTHLWPAFITLTRLNPSLDSTNWLHSCCGCKSVCESDVEWEKSCLIGLLQAWERPTTTLFFSLSFFVRRCRPPVLALFWVSVINSSGCTVSLQSCCECRCALTIHSNTKNITKKKANYWSSSILYNISKQVFIFIHTHQVCRELCVLSQAKDQMK